MTVIMEDEDSNVIVSEKENVRRKAYEKEASQNGAEGDMAGGSDGSGGDDAEDGEILEDGEIEEDAVECKQTSGEVEQEGDDSRNEEEVGKTETLDEPKEDSNSDKDNEESPKEKKKKDKKRRKKQREKEKKRKAKDDSKRKRKRQDYIDFDNVEESYIPKMRRRSPPGPYDSPYQSHDERMNGSPPGPYGSPYRSPPGPYDSPPESPPGPYDSPPEDSDGERYGDQDGRHHRAKKSMMGMLDDQYLDPTIAVSEKQDIFQSAPRGRVKRHRSKLGNIQQPRKKPLLETPKSDRPLCKFYKEGKCAKGSTCPFNHDFTPPKKPEICKFYLNSSCNKGTDCIYMHGEYPCKFFHTGAECFGGADCKFSHDPLTADTYPLLNKILDNDDEFCEVPPKVPRPSLLGSPPRHVKEAAERMKGDQVKKIPSLLDIEVFPPNKSPQKQQISPSKETLSPKPGRPGFYNETVPSTASGFNSTVLALGALFNKAAGQSPGYYQQTSPEHYQAEGQTGIEDSEIENSQDTQKLEDESQEGGRPEETTSDDDKRANIEVPSHLPPKQRELFMRIQHQQQLEGEEGEEANEEIKKEQEEPADDDDWYSSDEEDQPKPKLLDIIKNINQQKPTASISIKSECEDASGLSDSGSGIDVLQMLKAIRGQSSADGSVSSANQLISSLLPQSKMKKTKEIPLDSQIVKKEILSPCSNDQVDPMSSLPRLPKEGEELPYKVLTITISKTPYIPQNLNLTDPRVSSDPRIQRFISNGIKLETQTSNEEERISEPHSSDSEPPNPTGFMEKSSSLKTMDPRKGRVSTKSDTPSDPRRLKESLSNSDETPTASDPRLKKAMTELIQSAVNIPDHRLQKSQSSPMMAMHNIGARAVRPGFPMGFPRPPPGGPGRPMGPGPRPPGMPQRMPRNLRPPLLRTPIRPDVGFRQRGPRPFDDPRFGRQNSKEMQFGPMSSDPRNRPQGISPRQEPPLIGDPRNRVQGDSTGDPRSMPQGMSPRQEPPLIGDPRNRVQGVSTGDPRNMPQGMSPRQEPPLIGDPRNRVQGVSTGDPRSMPQGMSPRQEPPLIGDPRNRVQGVSTGDPRNMPQGMSPRQEPPLIGDPRNRVQGVPTGDPRNMPQGMSPRQEPPLIGDPRNRVQGVPTGDPRNMPQGMSPLHEPGQTGDPRNRPQGDPRNRLQGMSPLHETSPGFGLPHGDPRSRGSFNQCPPLSQDPRMRQTKPQDNIHLLNNPRLNTQGEDSLKKGDPRLDRHSASVDSSAGFRNPDPRLARQTSLPGITPSDTSDWAGHKDNSKLQQSRLNPRTDSESESNLGSPRIRKKRFIGERKGSMEYSSPLGLGSDQPDPAVSGFSNYNRPGGNRMQPGSKLKSELSDPTDGKLNSVYGSPVHSGYDSPQQEEIEMVEENSNSCLQAPPLKELFKTIDPTASPFC